MFLAITGWKPLPLFPDQSFSRSVHGTIAARYLRSLSSAFQNRIQK
ncbi:hypothetical protein RBSH_01082 [Rhodopirellula baltica SH28]|uniref:Uncharacterized protein n=1 Tax=Rhodopirellula baltica SH28 TaxID=993517 RepID=K5DME1_RHOBT|nr:hypothetical protein RBSH_01082 [Rhodopirellula baltica SH28]